MIEKSPFSEVSQVGVIVQDMERTIKYFESLRIGPFKSLKKLNYLSRRFRGEPIDVDSVVNLKIMIAQMGQLQLELIEPGEGALHWREFLDSKGEGIHHLGFYVDDIEKEQAKLVANGVRVLYESRFQNGGGAAYFETNEVGGVLLELIQSPVGGLT